MYMRSELGIRGRLYVIISLKDITNNYPRMGSWSSSSVLMLGVDHLQPMHLE